MKLAIAATMIRPRYFLDSIVAQLVSVSAFSHSLGQFQTCSGGKSLVCFYHESGPNRSRAGGGCTERKRYDFRTSHCLYRKEVITVHVQITPHSAKRALAGLLIAKSASNRAEPDLPRRFTTGSVVRTPFVLPSSATGGSHLGNLGLITEIGL